MESDLCSLRQQTGVVRTSKWRVVQLGKLGATLCNIYKFALFIEVFHIFALCTESLGKSLDERGSSPRNSTMKNYLTVFNLFVIMLVTMAVVPFWCCRHLVTKLRRKSAWL